MQSVKSAAPHFHTADLLVSLRGKHTPDAKSDDLRSSVVVANRSMLGKPGLKLKSPGKEFDHKRADLARALLESEVDRDGLQMRVNKVGSDLLTALRNRGDVTLGHLEDALEWLHVACALHQDESLKLKLPHDTFRGFEIVQTICEVIGNKRDALELARQRHEIPLPTLGCGPADTDALRAHLYQKHKVPMPQEDALTRPAVTAPVGPSEASGRRPSTPPAAELSEQQFARTVEEPEKSGMRDRKSEIVASGPVQFHAPARLKEPVSSEAASFLNTTSSSSSSANSDKVVQIHGAAPQLDQFGASGDFVDTALRLIRLQANFCQLKSEPEVALLAHKAAAYAVNHGCSIRTATDYALQAALRLSGRRTAHPTMARQASPEALAYFTKELEILRLTLR